MPFYLVSVLGKIGETLAAWPVRKRHDAIDLFFKTATDKAVPEFFGSGGAEVTSFTLSYFDDELNSIEIMRQELSIEK